MPIKLTWIEELLHLFGICQHPNLIPRFIGQKRKYYECFDCLRKFYIATDKDMITRKTA